MKSDGIAEHGPRRVGKLGHLIGSALRLHGMSRAARKPSQRRTPGHGPGIERAIDVDRPPEPGDVHIRCIDYGPDFFASRSVEDLEAFLQEDRPQQARFRWLDVMGLNAYTINRLRASYPFHTLAAEDVVHVPQRPKIEAYEDHLFVVLRMLRLANGGLLDEQVSLFLFEDTVVSVQEQPGDVWDPIRARLEISASRFRNGNACYLLYALVDAIVDHIFPILENYGDRLEDIERCIIEFPTEDALQDLYGIKRELVLLRRVLWPTRQVIDDLHRSEYSGVDASTRTYFRDVYDHTLQVIDILETYREMSGSLTELYMSSISNRMNEIMKVLTIMASLFIPVTFLAGVYGMNFEHIPELKWAWAYPVFWALCISISIGLLVFFRRHGWIGKK